MFPRLGLLTLAFAAWLLSATAGMAVLWTYESQPGQSAAAPEQWPQESMLVRAPAKQQMLVWVHPRCPCTRATIGELERLLTHLPDDVDCQVIITQPEGVAESFHETSLTESISRLPNVKTVIDQGQVEANRFGVSTSGQVLMYGRDSRLVFAGGITLSRGHEGDNQGTLALRDIFRQQQTPSCCRGNAVFGCELFANQPVQFSNQPGQSR